MSRAAPSAPPSTAPARDAGYPAPPGQIRACAANALGSHLGCWTRCHCCQRHPVRRPTPVTQFPGSGSGLCFADPRFPRPRPFPPRPPRPVARVCSAASLVLWTGLTSLGRASADRGRSLPAAAWRTPARRPRDLPVPVRMVSPRAWGLGPRRAGVRLAMAVRAVWPSAFLCSVGALDRQHFAAPYPARGFPCQRFAGTLTGDSA